MAPKRGEVRESIRGGDRYYVIGPYEPDYDDPEHRTPTVPLTNLVQVEGRWIGQKYGIPTQVVERMTIVSSPVDKEPPPVPPPHRGCQFFSMSETCAVCGNPEFCPTFGNRRAS